jgi:phage tail protein X
MPVDDGELMCREIANLFSRATLICIEIQGYRPGQGGVVTNLANYGRLLGIAEINAKVLDVAPKTWKDQVLGDAYDHKAKEGTILWAQDHYPKVNLVLPRCRTAHDGMADSLAIWHYAKDLV